jgi:TonB family protein
VKPAVCCLSLVLLLGACGTAQPPGPQDESPISGIASTPPEPAASPLASPGRPEQPLRVGGDVLPPRLLRSVPVTMPTTSGVQGTAVLEVVISAAGDVVSARALGNTHPEIEAAYVAAIKQWKFAPATQNEKPVAVYYLLTQTIRPQ